MVKLSHFRKDVVYWAFKQITSTKQFMICSKVQYWSCYSFSCTSSYTALWLIVAFLVPSSMFLTEGYAMLSEQVTVSCLWLIVAFLVPSSMFLTEAYAMLSEQVTVCCSKIVTVLSTVWYATLSVLGNSLAALFFTTCRETLHRESHSKKIIFDRSCVWCVCFFLIDTVRTQLSKH